MGRWPISRGLLLKVAPTVLRVYSKEVLHRATTVVPSKLAIALLFSAATSCQTDDRIEDLQIVMNPERKNEISPSDCIKARGTEQPSAQTIKAPRGSGKPL